jgi:hypothetical protein
VDDKMANSRNHAAVMNNLGIAILELGGDKHRAKTHFQAAVGIVRASIIHITHLKTEETRSPQGTTHNCPDVIASAERREPLLDLTETHSLFSNSRSSFLRTQGLTIPTMSIFSTDPFVDQIICSSIVVFNLALIYHEEGTQNCGATVCDKHLCKARLFYERSYKLLEGTGFAVLGSFTGNPFVDVLKMSLLNNLVHINFELSDYSRSELYRHHFVRSVACTGAIASYYPSDSRLAALLEKERFNFVLSLIVTKIPPHSAAA